jgi:hypothetical protein
VLLEAALLDELLRHDIAGGEEDLAGELAAESLYDLLPLSIAFAFAK